MGNENSKKKANTANINKKLGIPLLKEDQKS